MPGLDHLIPPPIIALTTGAGIYALAPRLPEYSLAALSRSVPQLANVIPYTSQIAGTLAVAGLGLSLSAMLSFHEKETTMTPLVPSRASRLVTSGVYAYTRNPMYLGLATGLAAWSIYLASPLVGAAGIGAFVAYITYFQIRPEEAALRGIFPVEFPAYVARVRRWL